jgi:hypothetical protein
MLKKVIPLSGYLLAWLLIHKNGHDFVTINAVIWNFLVFRNLKIHLLGDWVLSSGKHWVCSQVVNKTGA